MIYFVDVDNTICRTEGNNYRESDPYPEVIAKINDLFHEGHQIIYWTARGTSSGKDWLPYTERQLKSWGCLFDEVRTGKPGFDFIIDDRSRKTNEI